MPRLINDGEVRIAFVATLVDPATPTPTEANGGTNITPELQSLDTPLDGDAVPASDLSSAFRKTVAGQYGGDVTAEMYRESTTDAAYAAFPRNTTGYLVIRRFGGSDVTFANADDVEVWNVRVITRSPATMSADGSVQMFTVNFATLDEPIENAVITT